MPYQNIARFEREEREPTWPTVLKLAEALGVSPNDFLDGDGDDDDDLPVRPSKRK